MKKDWCAWYNCYVDEIAIDECSFQKHCEECGDDWYIKDRETEV